MALEDKVNEILGIETPKQKEEKEFKPPVARVEEKAKDDVDNDHKNSREYYYNLIDQGQEAIAGILEVAKEGQHPRAYEVALNKKLQNLKELPKSATPNIKNALFVGSTAELQKMLKKDEITESKNITPEETDITNK